jgi:hypothetical protein
MRCDNCGWKNRPENQKCEKCGAPLKLTEGAETVLHAVNNDEEFDDSSASDFASHTVVEATRKVNPLFKTIKEKTI